MRQLSSLYHRFRYRYRVGTVYIEDMSGIKADCSGPYYLMAKMCVCYKRKFFIGGN